VPARAWRSFCQSTEILDSPIIYHTRKPHPPAKAVSKQNGPKAEAADQQLFYGVFVATFQENYIRSTGRTLDDLNRVRRWRMRRVRRWTRRMAIFTLFSS
jgi:hypothetical protein